MRGHLLRHAIFMFQAERPGATQPDCVWIRRARFRCAKNVWKGRGQKLSDSLLTAAFPHSFTPYPHYAGAAKAKTGSAINNHFLDQKNLPQPPKFFTTLNGDLRRYLPSKRVF